jgi:AcrR family transcriptional regulator
VDTDAAGVKTLDAAEELFYGRGVQAVGMDDIRDASGVSLKQIYRLFPTKERLVTEVLRRRDVRWRTRLAEHVAAATTDPVGRLLAVFDWLHIWFSEPTFRGCAWINMFGELSAVSPGVVAQAREHKRAFREYLVNLVAAANRPPAMADHLHLLAEGAMTTAAISGSAEPANTARRAAELMLLRGGGQLAV